MTTIDTRASLAELDALAAEHTMTGYQQLQGAEVARLHGCDSTIVAGMCAKAHAAMAHAAEVQALIVERIIEQVRDGQPHIAPAYIRRVLSDDVTPDQLGVAQRDEVVAAALPDFLLRDEQASTDD